MKPKAPQRANVIFGSARLPARIPRVDTRCYLASRSSPAASSEMGEAKMLLLFGSLTVNTKNFGSVPVNTKNFGSVPVNTKIFEAKHAKIFEANHAPCGRFGNVASLHLKRNSSVQGPPFPWQEHAMANSAAKALLALRIQPL